MDMGKYVRVFGFGVMLATSGSFAGTLDGASEVKSSILKSDACNGSCVALLKTDSQVFLEIHDPKTGGLFRLVPLDVDVNVSIGDFTPASDGNAEAKVGGILDAPPGGTGVVEESGPFSDNHGDGIVYVHYAFSSGVIVNAQVTKVYVHERSA